LYTFKVVPRYAHKRRDGSGRVVAHKIDRPLNVNPRVLDCYYASHQQQLWEKKKSNFQNKIKLKKK